MRIESSKTNQPNWKEINVTSRVPAGLERLKEITTNLWWVWNEEARELFREIDPKVYKAAKHNPVLTLEGVKYERMEELVKDATFVDKLDSVYKKFRHYMDVSPDSSKPSVAYFSMEYGLTDILKIYSGGLGVLAGDYLKEASDCNVDMTAIGFLYRYGYFTQTLTTEGDQQAVFEAQHFNSLPIEAVKDETGAQMVIAVPMPGHTVYANLWRVAVGRVSLYLLDTDTLLNSEFDRPITYQLYGGDWENRLKQEYLLGIGGMQALKRLGIEKQVYHCNEGHAALINAERLADYVAQGLTFNQAFEVVKGSSLYTVHTPVPAGHDSFEEQLFYKYLNEYPAKLGISWEDFISLGRENPQDKSEKFSMSIFACNTCQEVNGVSLLHGVVSQHMFQPIWKGYFPEELHVSYVTNGVHLPTWAASEWKRLYERTFGAEYINDQSNINIWEKILQVPDETIWQTRMILKNKLINYIKMQVKEQWMKNQGDPARGVSIVEGINPNALIIGFGRRFATYKRAHLLFSDLDRLEKIVNNPNYPVQFLYTGKAHPADGAGQGLIKRIVEISRMPQFAGKVIFLENYDMRLAKRLISGVDVWLNTPTRPQEASGTSGEKAQMNGVLNFSVLDGWWYEGYVQGAGWCLTDKRTYTDQAHQDKLDALTIYSILENEIIPMFFAKNSKGYSPEWIQTIKNSIAQITPRFTTKRMLDDYIERFYNRLAERVTWLKADNFAKAKAMVVWKEGIAAIWENIEVVSLTIPDGMTHSPQVGEDYLLEAVIDTKDAAQTDIAIELVVTSKNEKNVDVIHTTAEFQLEKTEGSKLFFSLNYRLNTGGTFQYGVRMFPKNADLPNRQDFAYVKWI